MYQADLTVNVKDTTHEARPILPEVGETTIRRRLNGYRTIKRQA